MQLQVQLQQQVTLLLMVLVGLMHQHMRAVLQQHVMTEKQRMVGLQEWVAVAGACGSSSSSSSSSQLRGILTRHQAAAAQGGQVRSMPLDFRITTVDFGMHAFWLRECGKLRI
jgi:hypothetical protein